MASTLTLTAILTATVLLRGGHAAPLCACEDVVPPGTSCLVQKLLGNCFSPEVVGAGFCKMTCGQCGPCFKMTNQSVPSECSCPDVDPPGGFSCAQQASWGKCSEDWMILGGFCQGTCCACPAGEKPECACDDVQPPGDYTCADQAAWGKCDAVWIVPAGNCLGSCCACPVEFKCTCEDIQPPGLHTCAQQASWGKCEMDWMVEGGYCASTCDRCDCSPQTEPIIYEREDLEEVKEWVVDHSLPVGTISDTSNFFDSEIDEVEILEASLPLSNPEVAPVDVPHATGGYYLHDAEMQYQGTPIFIS